MKPKKLTKRQILNELLVLEDKKTALAASQDRLWDRSSKLSTAHRKLASELEEVCLAEAKKMGAEEDFDEPIFFKQHIFTVEPGNGYARKATVNIQGTKNVK